MLLLLFVSEWGTPHGPMKLPNAGEDPDPDILDCHFGISEKLIPSSQNRWGQGLLAKRCDLEHGSGTWRVLHQSVQTATSKDRISRTLFV